MTDLIPQSFPTPSEAVIATFDAEDLAGGVGDVLLFASMNEDTGAENLVLTRRVVYSSKVQTASINGTVTLTFDSAPLNLPRTAKGTAYINIGYAPSAGQNQSFSAQVQKWDGSSATDLSSEITTPTFTGSNTQTVASLELPLTQTIIKVGEQLRLIVKIIANGVSCFIGHDPKNRDGANMSPSTANTTTILTLFMPFDIDI